MNELDLITDQEHRDSEHCTCVFCLMTPVEDDGFADSLWTDEALAELFGD